MKTQQNGARKGDNLEAAPDGDGDSETLSLDETFEILANERRRFVLHYLQGTDGRADLGELAEYVAAWENDTDVEAVTSAQRKRVYTSLQQFHLPKMENKGVVAFHERDAVVELTDVAADIDIYTNLVEREGRHWGKYYLGVAVAGLALIGGSYADVDPLAMVPAAGWGLLVTTAVLASAAVQTYLRRTGGYPEQTTKPPELPE